MEERKSLSICTNYRKKLGDGKRGTVNGTFTEFLDFANLKEQIANQKGIKNCGLENL